MHLLILLGLLLQTAGGQPAVTGYTKGRDVSVQLKSSSNIGAIKLDQTSPNVLTGQYSMKADETSKPVQLEIEKVTLEADRPVEDLLKDRGIRPNQSAQSIFYDLNPEITSWKRIPKGATLQVPAIKVENKALGFGQTATLQVDSSLKNNIGQETATFRAASTQFEAQGVGQDIPDIVQMSNQISADKVPLSHEGLVQVQKELEFLNQLSGKSLTAEDVSKVHYVRDDLAIKVKSAKDERTDIPVQVRTLKGDGNEISNFVICYAPVALYDANTCEFSFPHQSSPTIKPLPVASYNLWAIKPGSAVAVSDIRKLEVRRGSEKPLTTLDLTILRSE
jgi:hypothetical protein